MALPSKPSEPEYYAGLYPREQVTSRLKAGENPVQVLRESISDAIGSLHERFRSGASVRELVKGRAWLLDQLLIHCWKGHRCPEDGVAALIAVGGYGRGELHPYSDIDLLILLEDDAGDAGGEQITNFLTFLWDVNLKVGHSVRTVSECVRIASEDITVATNIMESRHLAGNPELTERLAAQTGPEQIWPTDRFFAAKREEQIRRHHKYNDTEYNLEPNIKGSPGGLRDIQTVGWIAKRHFGAETLQDLAELGFLNELEFQTLTESQDFLWKLRYALHMVSDRDEDRLLFDHQRAIAEMFGLQDCDETLAVEKLMQQYYRAAQQVSHLNELLLQHFDEAILRAGELEHITPLNDRFQLCNGFVEAVSDSVFTDNPFALLELFVLRAYRPEILGVRAETIRLVRSHAALIDDGYRSDPVCTTLFMEVLRSRRRLVENLQAMQRYGVLERYLPPFGKVAGQMQHDLFHIYTVDAHTLQVLRNMQRFSTQDGQNAFPTAASIVHQLPRIEVLYLAGLFHDIAKGRGGDHSELGAGDATEFCKRHRLGQWGTNLVVWLVANHLKMSLTAQREDLSDPEVIQEFATFVGDQIRLDYLYALTVADICGTNPNLWNGWRASLLRQLYVETKRTLRRGVENPIDREEWVQEAQNQAMDILEARGIDSQKAREFWEPLGTEYFLHASPSEIAWHTEAILAHGDRTDPLVLIKDDTHHDDQGGTQVFVYTPDQVNLFAATASALDQLNLSIHDARIVTAESHFSFDTYIVLDSEGKPVGDDPERVALIRESLTEALRDPEEYPRIIKRHTPRQLKHFPFATAVGICNDARARVTILDVVSPDRPGLLARIGRIFLDFDINLLMAKITTLGERVEDTFYITDANHEPLSDPELCARLERTIIETLDSQVQSEAH